MRKVWCVSCVVVVRARMRGGGGMDGERKAQRKTRGCAWAALFAFVQGGFNFMVFGWVPSLGRTPPGHPFWRGDVMTRV